MFPSWRENRYDVFLCQWGGSFVVVYWGVTLVSVVQVRLNGGDWTLTPITTYG